MKLDRSDGWPEGIAIFIFASGMVAAVYTLIQSCFLGCDPSTTTLGEFISCENSFRSLNMLACLCALGGSALAKLTYAILIHFVSEYRKRQERV